MSKALATKNIAAVALGIGLVLALSFSFATPAKAVTIEELQVQIQALLAQIAALQGGGTGSQQVGGLNCSTFTRNHSQGDSGGEVMAIQKFLNSIDGTQLASTGAGSPGNETSYFGSITKAAVVQFQNKYAADVLAPVGLSAGTGYWGPSSRAKANALCAGAAPSPTPGGTPTPVPVTGSLNVAAGAQPANTLAPQGAVRVPFTTFSLANGTNQAVTVTGVVVQRGGLAQDAAFAGVSLVDSNGLQLGISRTLNSNHQATVGDTFTLQPGQSVTLTIVGNMAADLSSYTGQVASLAVVGVNTSVPVSGALPISGAQQTLNSTLSVGSVTSAISSFDPNSAQSKNIGDTGVKFTGVRLTAGSAEDLKLYSIRWRQVGSIAGSDLANVVTVVEGTSYPTAVSPDGRYFTTTFPGGILIQKGFSVDAYVQGDIIGSLAAGRTAEMDIDKTSDVYLVGQLYGYGIAPAAGSSSVSTAATHGSAITSSTPWFQGSTFSISGASATSVAKANEVPAQNIAVNVADQPLGGYVVDLRGEAVQVASQVFTIATTSGSSTGGSSDLLTNVILVDENGSVVAGPVDAADGTAGDGDQTVTFTDTVTYPTGRHVYTLKGKLASTATNNQTYVTSFTPSTAWTSSTGETTGNSFTWPSSAVTLNTMTVRAASLSVTMSSQPVSQSIVAGSTGVLFANIQLDAGQSGEDVRISAIPLGQNGTIAELTSCQLYDGTTALNTGSNVPTALSASLGTTTFSFDNSLVIAKGTLKTLALKCNVTSSATGDHFWTVGSGDTWSSTGVTSGASITESVTNGASGTMSIGTGSLAVSLDSSSPSYSVVAAGTTGVTMATYKLRPTNEAVWLNKLGISLTNTASSSASDLTTVYVYQGSTLLGTATFTGSNTIATSTFSSPVLLAKDTDTTITIKADLSTQGTSQPGTPGHLIAIDYNSADATGSGSGVNIQGSGSTAVSGVRIFKSYPIFTYSTTGATLFNGVNDLLTLSVQAPSAGPVKLYKLSFAISTTTAELASYTFTGPNGSVGTRAGTCTTTMPNPCTLTVTFDSGSNTADAEVGAGQTKSYTLKATVSGLTGTNSGSVSTALTADTAFPGFEAGVFMGTTTGSVALSNVIWSPMTTTSPSASGNDWTNAYGLGGCYTSAGLGQNCTARVIAK